MTQPGMSFFEAWRAMERGASVCRPNWDKIAVFYLRGKELWAIYKSLHEKRMTVVPVSIIVADDWQIADPNFKAKADAADSRRREKIETAEDWC